ncbi:hypothetical protein AAV96_00695 [Acinetobacter sp. AG1]|uniref:hypothetical protein n=1 Tax=Acinetobacter sp. AG1 TaxID=348388 RepID=UPI0006299EE0|nr:hypothetical protein [Acinetobacter sp. AG1]KKW82331.1 hypothetical protein AAV96_00695 [Acinetobacter sp. AG1]
MVASTDIKYYVHTNTNAPQLTNNFGCMIDVLDACLVNGFGSQTVSTLTAVGTTVTATFGSAHNFMQYQVIKIAGATQTEYNGEFRILTVPNANSITFQLAAAPSVTTATGTISCSLPALGWLKPYSGTGKAAYRSSNTLLASRPYLRVIDALDAAYTSTYAKYAKVGIVEEMTGIDTMSGVQAPYDSANPDKNWVGTGSGTSGVNGWARWYYAASGSVSGGLINSQTPAAGNRQWILVGNSDYFYILPTSTVPSATVNTQHASAYGFGAFKSLLNADNSCTFLQSHLTLSNNGASVNVNFGLVSSSASSSLLLLRDYAQSANYKTVNCLSLNSDTAGSGVNNVIGASTLTNTAPFAPVFIKEDTTNVLRGQIKNLFWLFQQKPYSNFQLIEKDGALYIAAFIASTSNLGQIVLKIGDL